MSDWKILIPEATTNKVRNPSAEESEIVGAELLSNEGFETAGAGGADVWESWVENASDGALANEAVIVHGGSDAAKLTAGPSADTRIFQDITVTPGKMYRYLFWTYGDGTYAGQYRLWDETNSAEIIAVTSTGVTAAAWTECDVAFIAPAACVEVRVYLYCPDTNTGVTYFDDASVKEVNAGELDLDDVLTRETTYSKWGLYAWRMQTTADNEGAMFALDALSNADHYITMRVRGTLPSAWDWSLDDSNYTEPSSIETLDDNWTLYGASIAAAQANGSTALYIRQNGAGSGDFYIDGIQVEEKTAYWTTYTDGDQDGCEWDGAKHDSGSARSAVSRAGGRVKDLADDYYFEIGRMAGFGASPQKVGISPYAILPGGEVNGVKVGSGTLTLSGVVTGTSMANLHANRQALVEELQQDRYPKSAAGWQPVRLRYQGAAVQKEVEVQYSAGMEGSLDANGGYWWERLALRFLTPDPLWYEIGNSSAELDATDLLNIYQATGRLKSTGQWSALGLTANPDGGAATTRALLVASDGSIYFGGGWTGFDSVVGRDYIARYIPSTDTWETVGGDSDFNGEIYALAEGPDGTIYAAGAFTNCGGDADADYLAQWDGDSWSAVGIPNTGAAAITTARCLAFDRSGNLYIGGDFTDWADVANADYLVKWDGSSYTAVGSGGTGAVNAIVLDSSDNIFIGGEFTGWAADGNADYWAWWNSSAWAAVDDIALGGNVYALAIDPSDVLYVGGAFTDADSVANADKIFSWNGTAVSALGTGVAGANNVWRIVIGPDGSVYISGDFDEVGELTTTTGIARWNGAAWAHLDIEPASIGVVYAMGCGKADPAVPKNYDLWITGINPNSHPSYTYIAGKTTVTNAGSASRQPVFKVKRDGSGTATFYSLRNETIGTEILSDYGLLDGETLTVDMRPTKKAVTSSFFGSRPDGVLANSDFGAFALQPNDNDITCFIDGANSAAPVTAWLEYRTAYRGMD